MNFVLGIVENIVGKGENAGYQHFLLFPQCFQNASFPGSLKVGIVWKRVTCRDIHGTVGECEKLSVCRLYHLSNMSSLVD